MVGRLDPRHRRIDRRRRWTCRRAPGTSRSSTSPPSASRSSAPGFKEDLIPALDGQRPSSISLNNNGQFWPAGKFQSTGGKVEFTIDAASADWLQSLTGWDAKAYIGEIVATKAEPHRDVPLSQACGGWIDWYEGPESP